MVRCHSKTLHPEDISITNITTSMLFRSATGSVFSKRTGKMRHLFDMRKLDPRGQNMYTFPAAKPEAGTEEVWKA
jgi:hypothetical protein